MSRPTSPPGKFAARGAKKPREATDIKDIVRHSGTSLATVSRVLNDSGYVGKETRERVERAMRELNYLPNAGARQMRSGRSNLVGVLLPSLDVPFFGILAQTLEQSLSARGYSALFCNTSEKSANETRYISTLIGQNVDGMLVLSATSRSKGFRRVVDMGIPTIAIDRAVPDLTPHVIAADHREGGHMMARHLLALGHERIAIVGGPRHTAPIVQRAEGTVEALAEAGLTPVFRELAENQSLEIGHELTSRALARGPTAIVGTSDLVAIGSIHAVVAAGLSVPRDVSVIGFDDLPEAAYVLPGLTTIHHPVREIGELAVARLLHLVRPDAHPEPTGSVPPMRLIERDSTARPSRSAASAGR